MTTNPLEDHSLDGLPPLPGGADQAHPRRPPGAGPRRQEHGPVQELLRARACATGSTTARWTSTYRWLDDKFGKKPLLAEANKLAMKAGYAYCDATEAFQISYEIPPAKLAPGLYRNISGNTALALGFVAAVAEGRAPALPGLLPDHARLRHPARALDVQELRRDDLPGRGRDRGHRPPRSAPPTAARSPSPRPPGPGMALKTEAIGLAIAVELPLVIVRHPARRALDRPADQDRAGRPAARRSSAATPRPRCRCSPRPRPATASGSPSRRAASRSSTWCRDRPLRRLPRQRRRAVAHPERRRAAGDPGDASAPIPRASCPTRATRTPWRGRGRSPARPGLEHRIGGLEKQDGTGNVNYEPLNHEQMVRLRAAKVEAIVAGRARRRARRRSRGRPADRRLGLDLRRHHRRAARRSASKGRRIGHVHLRHLNPLPRNLGEVLKRYKQGPGARDEPGPARLGAAREVPGGRRRASTRSRASPSSSPRSKPRSRRS